MVLICINLRLVVLYRQGHRQKNFQRGQRKKDRKRAKKDRKIALLSLFQEGGQRKKDRQIAKKDRKIAIKDQK